MSDGGDSPPPPSDLNCRTRVPAATNRSVMRTATNPQRTLTASVVCAEKVRSFLIACRCLTVSVVGIANTTLVATMERISEIGLRRALGTLDRRSARHLLTESVALVLIDGSLHLILHSCHRQRLLRR
ncbi:ABC transporter permease [Streptomyces sp. NBC_00083]|uniref:ABC transporter permease n=1 Tax=Streptomyces sp. NBC_00083 TaxID=2975647 RepID=UPI002B1D65E3|nr:ABC transporter permease [Streptomyces sp. NBC_00083]